MPEYRTLLENAKNIAQRLSPKRNISGFFCCYLFSTTDDGILKHAKLIESAANVLELYPAANDQIKSLILQGLYLYIWQDYESLIQVISKRMFILILQEHMEINSPSELSDYKKLGYFSALEKFCYWVFCHQKEAKEIHRLFMELPNDMQAKFYELKHLLSNQNHRSSWLIG